MVVSPRRPSLLRHHHWCLANVAACTFLLTQWLRLLSQGRLRSWCEAGGCGGALLPSSAHCLGAMLVLSSGRDARFQPPVKAHLGSQLSVRWANSYSITWMPICRVYVRVYHARPGVTAWNPSA